MARGNQADESPNRNTHPADTGLAAHHSGVECYSLQPIQGYAPVPNV